MLQKLESNSKSKNGQKKRYCSLSTHPLKICILILKNVKQMKNMWNC